MAEREQQNFYPISEIGFIGSLIDERVHDVDQLRHGRDDLFTTPLWQRANDEGWRPFWVPAEQYFHELRPAVSQPALVQVS